MTRTGPPSPRIDAAWRPALLGAGVAASLTVLYRLLADPGATFALEVVFVGGLVAGYAARRATPAVEVSRVGLRAGALGGAPVTALALSELLVGASTAAGPLFFRVGATLMALSLVAFVLALGVALGLVGAKAGAWLASARRDRSPASG